MGRFVLGSSLIAVGVLAATLLLGSGTSRAVGLPWQDPAGILDCMDVNADGSVVLDDILAVASKFGAVHGQAEYLLSFDENGDGTITLDDILETATHFGEQCSLLDVQISRATLAMAGEYGGPDLRNWSEAKAAGYIQSTQYVGQMGIHVYNLGYQAQYTAMDPSVCDPREPTYDDSICQLEHPAGLVYTNDGTGAPDELIGAWYLVPNQEVCEWAGNPNPSSCLTVGQEPIGFGYSNCGVGDSGCADPEEDNGEVSATNQGWHDHQGLCGGNWASTDAWVVELHFGGDPGDATAQDEQDCMSGSILPCGPTGCAFFYTYGWMMHLYNFIPNPAGRFMQWNSNLSNLK